MVDMSGVVQVVSEQVTGVSLVGVSVVILLVILLIFSLIVSYLLGFVDGAGRSIFKTSRANTNSTSGSVMPSVPPPPGFY